MAKLLLFVHIKEKVQTDSLVIPAKIRTIAELESWLGEEYPTIKEDLAHVIWAKNEEYVELEEQIEPDDVIAMIAPVSGG